ncbi:hypothetical protein BDZ91DRAFT_799550 [Kalaharituber pfeilii]|nr:hypothetical protein BDZ91DRAFT_799550 [Kalaharituber pfeilii]
MSEFNPVILRSGLFKIILPDANVDVTSDPYSPLSTLGAEDSHPSVQESTSPIFYVHKALLASISPEFLKHIDNEMREGLEGEMILREVDMETMETFLKWAYVKEYSLPAHLDPMIALLAHIKVYVFGDRFNILALKEQTLAKATEPLVQISSDRPAERSAPSVLLAAQYAIGNLPSVKEPLVAYLLQYLAQGFTDVCKLPEFLDLANSCPEAIVEICRASTRDATSTKPKAHAPSSKIDISGDTDELVRDCVTCGVTEVVNFRCSFQSRLAHTWQPSPGSFITYEGHPQIIDTSKGKWYLTKCPCCNDLRIFLEREHLECSVCRGSDLVRPEDFEYQ